METTIPTMAEQMELAALVIANLAPELEIDGRRYRVVQVHNDIRFLGRSKFQGEIAPSAHIAVLRSDLCKAQTLPCEYQDRKLAARCEQIVAGVLARL